MRYGPTPASETKAKLAFGWPCHSRAPRAACGTTPRDPRNLSLIVDEKASKISPLRRQPPCPFEILLLALLLKPQPPQPIHAGMSNRRSRHAPPRTPCAPIKNPRDRRQQHIAPIKMYGPLIEVRQPEQHRCNHQSCTPTYAPLQQVLPPGAKEEFFRHCGQEKYPHPA